VTSLTIATIIRLVQSVDESCRVKMDSGYCGLLRCAGGVESDLRLFSGVAL